MRPSEADIQALYATAAAGGLTTAEVDAIAVPLITRSMAPPVSLRQVRTRDELRTITAAVHRAIADRNPSPPPGATAAQIDYAVALGADRDTVAAMTRRQASELIDQIKAETASTARAAAKARAAGRRHGIDGEIWD
jgi:hypothetical protein